MHKEYKNLPNNIRRFRKKRGMTLETLAKLADSEGYGITKDTLSKLERGERTLSSHYIQLLCKLLSCTPNDLLGDSNIELVVVNTDPVFIDETIYALAKEVVLEVVRDQGLSFSEETLLDQVVRAYRIGMEIKQESGDVRPVTLATRWLKEL